jgi:hypothetical protein
MKAPCTVIVVYQNADTRATAMAFCDRLVAQFWTQLDFEITWWAFEKLEEEQPSQEALHKAVDAGMIIFASQPQDSMPFHMQSWIERWLGQRGEREGVLIDLSGEESQATVGSGLTQVYLRKVAHQAGMNYLTQMPQSFSEPLPESPDSVADLAGQVTSVLQEILDQRPRPPEVMS